MIEFKNQVDNMEIYITDVIDEYTFNAQEFKNELNKCNNITLYINSVGGDVFLGNTMANMIKEHQTKGNKVNCIITGLCASISTQIAIACDNIQIYSNGIFMIHNASCLVYGNKEEMQKQIEILSKIDDNLADAYQKASAKRGVNADIELFKELMLNESWLTSQQTLELGLVDEIVDNEVQMVACANIDKLHFKNTSIIEKLNKEIEIRELSQWLSDFGK